MSRGLFDNYRTVKQHQVMETKQAIAALGALAQEIRLEVFRLLIQEGPEGLPAGVIAERLKVLPPSLSFHLQQLVHAGLITQRRSSRHIIYSANYSGMNELMGYLTENCCAGAATAGGAAVGCVLKPTPLPQSSRRRQAARSA
jgi:ArsR family transcriptional regulator, arsenate/arsenite/antimonite-responsive transcriptional repressor